ncbi:TPA: hypothetical protein DCE37_06960 [Candidatus Latescibacteria bacterium]|nr:hypothetical protein [Candidatus Latescibacterota bacterium]
MNILTKQWPPLLTLLLCGVGGHLAVPYLPKRIPVHWGIDGSVSAHASREIGVFLNPAAMVVAYLFFTLIPYSDKRRVRDLRELGVYEPLRNTAVYVFALSQILSLGIGLGILHDQTNYLAAAVCLVFALISNGGRHGMLDPVLPHILLLNRLDPKRSHRFFFRFGIAGGTGLVAALTLPAAAPWVAVPFGAVILLERIGK